VIGNPLKIKDLVPELERGGIRIPEIQRSYVWRRSQIAKLLDSIYHGYPLDSVPFCDSSESPKLCGIGAGIGGTVVVPWSALGGRLPVGRTSFLCADAYRC
jgi:Protein of unknown function DUF262